LYSAVKLRRFASATTSGSGRILALLSNYDQENCLINVGTEGAASN